MTPEVFLHPKVFSDVEEIARYYRCISENIAGDFREEFWSCVGKVARNPMLYRRQNLNLRRINFRRFPHHLLYRITSGSIDILVIRHHARNPSFGMERF